MKLSAKELHDLCAAAARASGADDVTAEALAAATVAAGLHGHPDVGVAHLLVPLA